MNTEQTKAELVNHAICINFAFAYCQHKVDGKNVIDAFIAAGNEFKREIKSMHISRRPEGDLRRYLFTDGSICIYNMHGDYFKFSSQLKQTIC